MKPNQNPVGSIDEQIAVLQRRKNVLGNLLKEREKIDAQIIEITRGGNLRGGDVTGTGSEPVRKLALPRGVITLAAFNALKQSKKPMSVSEVTEAVKQSPLIKDSIPSDIEKRVSGVLHTSDQFKKVGRGVFTATGKLEGKLFSRLLAAQAA